MIHVGGKNRKLEEINPRGAWARRTVVARQLERLALAIDVRQPRVMVKRCLMGMCCLLGLNCAGSLPTSGEGVDYGFYSDGKRRRVWSRGPWDVINPSADVDDVIDQLCPAVMKLGAAAMGDYGREYCGVIYRLIDGPQFYVTVPSPLSNPEPDSALRKKKTCIAPTAVRDPRGKYRPEADFHSHTWPTSGMSLMDLVGPHYYFVRVQFDASCHIQRYVPRLQDSQPGELFERADKAWRFIGYVDPFTGEITPSGS
jgi:hypothetical protein